MNKSPDAFRTISEVADFLETPAHVLRFWESRFTQIRPVKRAGGRRYYRPADVALLTGIVASAFATRVRTHELEFTTEVEELLKDGQVDPKERRTIEHLRREFSITEEHARAIIRQILEEKNLIRPKGPKP